MTTRLRLLGIPLAIAALLGIGLATPNSSTSRLQLAPPATYYVALGDSYSSGVGAGGNTSGGDCDRSTNAYPALFAAAQRPAGFSFQACSGATTSDVVAHQLAALSDRTTLVSITIGGNDVGFVDVMVACTIEGPVRCNDEITSSLAKVREQLPAKLNAVYAAIAQRAPHARVVVLTYPLFYDVTAAPCPGVLDAERTRINAGTTLLDETIVSVAGRHGFTVGDVRPAFAAGHQICDDGSWMHSVDLFAISQSYHPTADGQRLGYLPALTAAAR